jgi:hypothetical protein
MAKITVYLSPKKLSPKPRSAACRPALERVRNTLERDIYLAWRRRSGGCLPGPL